MCVTVMQDLSGHPLGKKLSRPFEDLELHLQEVEDSEFRWKKMFKTFIKFDKCLPRFHVSIKASLTVSALNST